MSFGSERKAVQEKIIKYAHDISWEYLSPEEALIKRNGENNIILKEIFIDQFLKLNPKIDHQHAEEIIKKLERIPANIEGNLTAWEYLKGLKQIFILDENREINLKLLDTENISNNTFHITDELKFISGNNTNRYDLVFYINGFPVLMVETKATHKIDGLIKALEQVKRYHNETPEAFALLQIFSITHLIHFLYSATWNFSSKDLNRWKHQGKYNFEDLIKTFFDKKNIIKLITDYILFTKKDDRLNKVVLKPHQLRAVDKVIKRAKDKKKKRGLIWHTQGSGKTYTMITAAKLILENPQFENPTVIMLVDRNELEQQLFNNLSSVGIEDLRVALSKKDLQKLLIDDYRGLIISTIHKFHLMPSGINKRKNIFVFIDEAHRTTEGDLGTYLMSALPNATIIGFTGTPRDKTKHGKGTFIIFGKDDPPYGYLDKYSILESIEDGTTLKINYALAENSLLPDKETLEKEFLSLKEIEGVSDIETLNRALQKSATLRNFLKNKDRIDKITQYIAKHFKENVEPMGYKAFIVAVDREACAIYKEALDQYLPPEYSELIISKSHNDPPQLKKYHYTEEEEKLIRKRFKEKKNPKILIVTEKLLTGFDAPILYAMYLDKPMRDHVLLQAIARVNRPYEDENGRKKPAGLIIDFVGILDNLEKALAFDSSDIEGVLTDLEVLKGYLKDLIEEGRIKYLSILKGKTEDKAVEEVLNYFKDEEKRHNFYQFYEELKSIYEILTPDTFLRPYIQDFAIYTRIYNIVKQAYEDIDIGKRLLQKELSEKIKNIIKETKVDTVIKEELEIVQIDENTLKTILNSKSSETEKVFNLLKSIELTIKENIQKEPYLISLAERVENLAKEYQNNQKTTKEMIEELKKLSEEIIKMRKELKSLGLSLETFTVYWILKQEGATKALKVKDEIQKIFDEHKLWKTNSKENNRLKIELTKLFIKLLGKERIKEIPQIINKILNILR